MANLITHSLSFSKESINEYFLKPVFIENEIRDIITVRTDIKTGEKLDFIGKLTKITKAYAQGTSFTSATGVTITQKEITTKGMKAEAYQNGKAFLNYVKQAALKAGVNENNISGTIFEKIVMDVFVNGLRSDFQRQVCLNNTLSETLSSGLPTGVANPDYSVYEGFWPRFIKDVIAGTIPSGQRVAINNSAVAQVATHTLTGTSGTANIAINGVNYLATFAVDLTTTAANFVTSHAAALLLRGIVATSSGATVILTASIAGVAFTTTAAANVSGNLAGSLAATTANTAPAALSTDEAADVFSSMVKAATNELISMDGCYIACTRSMIENYKSTLRVLNGSESAVEMMLNGRRVLSFDGYPIIVRKDWDTHLAADFPGQYPHRAWMSVKENLIFGTDGASDDNSVEVFYDQVSQNNIFRAEYKAGTQYIHPELIVLAY